MAAPVRKLEQKDLERELENLKEAMQALVQSYESMNRTFHQYLESVPEMSERYDDFLTEKGITEWQRGSGRTEDTLTMEEQNQERQQTQEQNEVHQTRKEEQTRQAHFGRAL
ncbi:MAG: hypothetical protein LUG93_13790 [Lachnospiraceae bacterium]|nr:hypothetical protein [Lachnospiraceae bacterium]